jgi:hypothetical protein
VNTYYVDGVPFTTSSNELTALEILSKSGRDPGKYHLIEENEGRRYGDWDDLVGFIA